MKVDPTNLGEVLACAGIARLLGPLAQTGFEGDEFICPPLDQLTPSLAVTRHGLRLCGHSIDWWQPWSLNPGLKFWAGRQTVETVHRSAVQAATGSVHDWLTVTAGLQGRLGVDARAGWDAVSLGWSLDDQAQHQIAGRPWLEILASFGLQAFPVAGDKRDGYRYHTWRYSHLPTAVAAFSGYGLYSGPGYCARTAKNGSNTYLLPAQPI